MSSETAKYFIFDVTTTFAKEKLGSALLNQLFAFRLGLADRSAFLFSSIVSACFNNLRTCA
jgi:hypothetical protein